MYSVCVYLKCNWVQAPASPVKRKRTTLGVPLLRPSVVRKLDFPDGDTRTCDFCDVDHPPSMCPMPSATDSSDVEMSVCQGRGCGGCEQCIGADDEPPQAYLASSTKRPKLRHIHDYPTCDEVGVVFRMQVLRKRAANGLGFETLRTFRPVNCFNPDHPHYCVMTYDHHSAGGIQFLMN